MNDKKEIIATLKLFIRGKLTEWCGQEKTPQDLYATGLRAGKIATYEEILHKIKLLEKGN